jgi:hypothetical protein
MARRQVTVRGEWHLWVSSCDWVICQDGARLATSHSADGRVTAALRTLDGQALREVQVAPDGRRSLFTFDLGGVLETLAYATPVAVPPDEQWLLFDPAGWVLAVRGDGRYTYHPGATPPTEAIWLSLDEEPAEGATPPWA